MRYIPVHFLQPGQKLADDLRVSNSKILIRRGVILSAILIQKIYSLGFQGVYVDDKLSDGLEIIDIISHDLKIKTRSEVESLFVSVEKNFVTTATEKMLSIKTLVRNIVDEISKNRRVMLNIIDLRAYDDYTYNHSLNVAVLSTIIGIALGMNKCAVNELAIGALLHDMGKMFVDKNILNKPEKLNPEEFEHIKTHSRLGYEYLRDHFDIPQNSKLIALQHHEQYSGKGYPERLSGENIHKYGRIVCVADVYDALISDRPYRKALLPSDAIEYIMCGFNTMFDPEVVKALTRKVAPYPIGTCLRLSSGEMCIVVENHESAGLRPVVKIIEDNQPTGNVIDLADRSALNLAIREIVNI
jgi:HD-GYP domain-containing protein (c-di-GMP phosphodiesterase class II)